VIQGRVKESPQNAYTFVSLEKIILKIFLLSEDGTEEDGNIF